MHAMLHQVCGRVHKRERARSQSGDVNHRAGKYSPTGSMPSRRAFSPMKNHRSVRSVRSVARCAAFTEETADAWILREKTFLFPNLE